MNRRSFFARAAAIGGSILAACSPGAIRLAEASEEPWTAGESTHGGRLSDYNDWPLGIGDWTTAEPEPWLDHQAMDSMWENIEPRMSVPSAYGVHERSHLRPFGRSPLGGIVPGSDAVRAEAEWFGRRMYGTLSSDSVVSNALFTTEDIMALRRAMVLQRPYVHRRPRYSMRLIES